MKSAYNKIYFFVSALAFIVFLIIEQVFYEKFAEFWFAIGLNLLIATSFFFVLQGYDKSISTRTVTGSIDKIFRNLIFIGLFILLINAIFIGICNFFITSPQWKQTILLLAISGIINYFIYAFVLYKKLVLLRSSIRLNKTWRILHLVLFLALGNMIFYYFAEDLFFYLNVAILFSAFILGLVVVANNKWIAYIDRKTKITCILYLVILLLLSISLAFLVINVEIDTFTKYNLFFNAFFPIIFLFFVAYNLFALSTIIFNWPLFSTIENQFQAVKDFQVVNQKIIKNQDRTELYEWLLSASHNACSAEAAYLHIHSNKEFRKANKTAINLSENVQYQLREKVDWRNLKESINYFPDLKDYDAQFEDFKSSLVITLSYNDLMLANIILFKNIEAGFDQYMLDLVETYAMQAQLLLKDADLFEKNLSTERYQSELNTARRVQMALFPKKYPFSDKYEIGGFTESATEIGGDYFDFLELEDGRLAVIIADVSGSGTSAALYMSELKGIFQAMVRMNLPLELILTTTNDALYSCMEAKSFITLTLCFFDFENNILEYVRAGHTPLIHFAREDNSSSFLVDEGMGVGMFGAKIFNGNSPSYNLKFESGDIFLLYTDGMSEMKNNKGEPYGDERLRFGLDRYSNLSAEEMVASLAHDQVEFCDEFGEADDKSLLVIKIK